MPDNLPKSLRCWHWALYLYLVSTTLELFYFLFIITDRKGVISKGTLVPTEQSKWHLCAWHADTAVPVHCRIQMLTTNCSWGWLRTCRTEREFYISRLIDRVYVASMENSACVTLRRNLQRNCMGWKNVYVHTYVFICVCVYIHTHA